MIPLLILLGGIAAALIVSRRRTSDAPPSNADLFDAARAVGRGMLAGFAAGLIAGGAGSRILMKLVAVAAGASHQGQQTDAGATVGKFTVGGTMFLLMASGILGIFGALAYLALRRWLPSSGWKRGAIYGLLLFAVLGHPVVNGENVDFALFTTPIIPIAGFFAVYVGYGTLLGALADRYAPVEPLASPKTEIIARNIAFAVVGGLAVFGIARLAVTISKIYGT